MLIVKIDRLVCQSAGAIATFPVLLTTTYSITKLHQAPEQRPATYYTYPVKCGHAGYSRIWHQVVAFAYMLTQDLVIS